MDLKVGELYTNVRVGLFVVVELYDSVLIPSRGLPDQIGTCHRLNFGDRVYKLYHHETIREATDADIQEFLLDKLSTHYLNEQDFVTINEEGVTIYGDVEAVALNKDAAMKLKDLLNRELA